MHSPPSATCLLKQSPPDADVIVNHSVCRDAGVGRRLTAGSAAQHWVYLPMLGGNVRLLLLEPLHLLLQC